MKTAQFTYVAPSPVSVMETRDLLVQIFYSLQDGWSVKVTDKGTKWEIGFERFKRMGDAYRFAGDVINGEP